MGRRPKRVRTDKGPSTTTSIKSVIHGGRSDQTHDDIAGHSSITSQKNDSVMGSILAWVKGSAAGWHPLWGSQAHRHYSASIPRDMLRPVASSFSSRRIHPEDRQLHRCHKRCNDLCLLWVAWFPSSERRLKPRYLFISRHSTTGLFPLLLHMSIFPSKTGFVKG